MQPHPVPADLPVERPETLALYWPEGHRVPDVPVPSPYVLVAGLDREGFRAVQRSIGFELTDRTWEQMARMPGTMVLVRDDTGWVATACAEQRGSWAELAWVAVDPAHRGRGLGQVVSAAVVRTLRTQGHTRIFGSTQDERLEALRIYLDLGFLPVERPEKADRWRALRAALSAGR